MKAQRVHVSGTVQGVGFRPFVYRSAVGFSLTGWVRNAGDGVEIHVEGSVEHINQFITALVREAPPAALVRDVQSSTTAPEGHGSFIILASGSAERPTVRISPDLPLCSACRTELFDASDRRAGYPYVNCTNCGPRYSIIEGLPYDRDRTTMSGWRMCDACAAEYEDPGDRRYHAQPNACPECGPSYRLMASDGELLDRATPARTGQSEGLDATGEGADGREVFTRAAGALRDGAICAVKGLGGYHLACDAQNPNAVRALRERKYRKEKPFAVMVRNLEAARRYVDVSEDAEALLHSTARPIVLMPARIDLEGVAPGNRELGIMLPYAPVHDLLFDAGAPEALVMTSGNRSSEPIAYRDEDALERLAGLADVVLVGERPIARRVEDSVARVGPQGRVIIRRSRGYAPSPVASIPSDRPILALGADLKNAVTLVVDGEAFVSQHIGDLAHFEALTAFEETVRDLLDMYRVPRDEVLVVHDAHPQYVSTSRAAQWADEAWGAERIAVQHHRAHVASVLAERGELYVPIVGLALDGTGFGEDGTIWGGEIFVGSAAEGFERAAHLRPARLPGGDAAAEHPVQAAAGFLAGLEDGDARVAETEASRADGSSPQDFLGKPFHFPDRYQKARRLLERDVRTFATTSVGRLFDTAAALLGFTRAITFEGQAAIWLEQLAARSASEKAYPFPDLDFRPLLAALIQDVRGGCLREEAARAFHLGLAGGFAEVATRQAAAHDLDTVALSGGVFQNQILVEAMAARLVDSGLRVWMNGRVPPNDGGISLGQAAIAAAQAG